MSLPYSARSAPASPDDRPPYQGANPVADVWSAKALEYGGRYLRAAVAGRRRGARRDDARGDDGGRRLRLGGRAHPARLRVSDRGFEALYVPPGYPTDHPFVPHGISVIVTAPAAFRFTYPAVAGAPRAGRVAAGLDGDGPRGSPERPVVPDGRSRRAVACGPRLRRVRHPRPGRGRARPGAPARRVAAAGGPTTTSRRSCARVCTVKSQLGVVSSQRGGEIIRRVPLQLPYAPLEGHTSARIAAIAARQHALITIWQLYALGLDTSAVAKRVARGTLHRRYRGVYAVGQPTLSPEGESAGRGPRRRPGRRAEPPPRGEAAWHLALPSAAHRRRDDDEAAAQGRRGAPRPHARPARRHHATTASRVPPSTARLVDLADDLTPYQLANVIHEAAYRGRFVEAAVRDSMDRVSGRRKLHVLERAIELHHAGSAGTKSAGEDAFLTLGFPEPHVNTDLHGFEVDFHWPEHRLVVEIDGGGHSDRHDAGRDRVLHARLPGAAARVLSSPACSPSRSRRSGTASAPSTSSAAATRSPRSRTRRSTTRGSRPPTRG